MFWQMDTLMIEAAILAEEVHRTETYPVPSRCLTSQIGQIQVHGFSVPYW